MSADLIKFDKFFRASSFGVALCGFLSLICTGELGTIESSVFLVAFALSWFLEGSNWQLSERIGTASFFVVVPLFYIAWKFGLFSSGSLETEVAGVLSRLILCLAAIKLLQKKTERDWLFLYLMSFFEVLLAAGMSISGLYLASVIFFFLVAICAMIAFEIRRTYARISIRNRLTGTFSDTANSKIDNSVFRRVPFTSIAILILVVVVAAPLFFALPRTGAAGFGNNRKGLSGFTGFSDTVELGAIGKLKQNDEIVMRVVLDDAETANRQAIRWRGTALDDFDNRVWRKSEEGKKPFFRMTGDLLRFDQQPASQKDIAIQTVYLEPINSDALFAAARPFAIQQSKFQAIYRDYNGDISFPRTDYERVAYTIYSDRRIPSIDELRADESFYSSEISEKYLQLPDITDRRITELAAKTIENRTNRYDKALAIETYLQTQFGYTLELKAGGDQPLADFLFNIREGHCEYFATAMAVMLRTQGIAARIVNGFQQGEYNETADAFIVRQSDAHSWVEVYFPESDAWIAFDPTPFAGQSNNFHNAGIFGGVRKYLEAFETFWVQYFVAYDNQDQRSLFRSVKNNLVEFQAETSSWVKVAEKELAVWWENVRGDKGIKASAIAITHAVGYILLAISGFFLIGWIYRKIKNLNFWKRLREWLKRKNEATIVEFYERMQKVLASKGFTREPHQTPLEFAFALEMPEAVKITEKYNRVRFGEKKLSNDEAQKIEVWLKHLEDKEN